MCQNSTLTLANKALATAALELMISSGGHQLSNFIFFPHAYFSTSSQSILFPSFLARTTNTPRSSFSFLASPQFSLYLCLLSSGPVENSTKPDITS